MTNLPDLIDSPDLVYITRCKALANLIMKDQSHPLNQYFKFLPHGKRLGALLCNTTRFHNSFVPSSVNLFNCQNM